MLEHGSGGLHCSARGEAGLQIGPQGEAHERCVRERLTAMTGDVADDHSQLAVLEREDVVEVSAGGGSGGGAVVSGRADGTEARGRSGQQSCLQQADVLEQLTTLKLKATSASCDQPRANTEREGEREQRANQQAHRRGHDADDLGDRSRQR